LEVKELNGIKYGKIGMIGIVRMMAQLDMEVLNHLQYVELKEE